MGEVAEQASRGTSIGHHIQHCAELAALVEVPSGKPVQCI